METVSKNTKPKRGRPRIVPPFFRDAADAYGGCTRTQVNHYYKTLATQLFIQMNNPAFDWIVDVSNWPKPKHSRFGILVELGRMVENSGPDALYWAAVHISSLDPKPTTRQAETILRRMRNKTSKTGNADELHRAIMKAVDAYLIRWPETSLDDIRDAMRRADDETEARLVERWKEQNGIQ